MKNPLESNISWFTRWPVVKIHSRGANNSPFCRYNLSRDFFHIKRSSVEKEGFNWPAVKGLSIRALEADILIFILPLLLANVKGWESDSVSTGSMEPSAKMEIKSTHDMKTYVEKSVCGTVVGHSHSAEIQQWISQDTCDRGLGQTTVMSWLSYYYVIGTCVLATRSGPHLCWA